MSAFLCVTKNASLDLLTDAVQYDAAGIVHRIESKVHVLPQTRCVITGRGELLVAKAFALNAEGKCFDDVVRNFDAIFVEIASDGRRHIGEKRFSNHEILIAGWSESRHRPEAYHIAGHGLPGMTRTLSYVGLLFACGPLPPLNRFMDGFTDVAQVDAFDAMTDGVPVMEAMRHERLPIDGTNPESVEGHGVGGFVEWTHITSVGVFQGIIHRWPDEVGRRIELMQ